MKPRSTVVTAATVVATLGTSVTAYLWWLRARQRRKSTCRDECMSAYESLIGNTPLVRLERLSSLLHRSIYVKMESLNPGGTGKDRAALSMIQQAERSAQLPPPYPPLIDSSVKTVLSSKPNEELSMEEMRIFEAMKHSRTGGLVVEGTSGSTGISVSGLCKARGHACLVILPDDQASEKQVILKALGAVVHVVPNCAISNPNHYVNIARRIVQVARNKFHIAAVFLDQFENLANYNTHYENTGLELWRQCPQMDAFVMSSGTGGTIAGVGSYLKKRSNSRIRVVLVDPPGSALYHRIHHGVAYAPQQRERTLKRHRYDTLAEGIGLDRMTANFQQGVESINDAVQVSDQEAVDMAHWLLQYEGLWVGSSSAMNVVGAVRTAEGLKSASTVVTVICDTGQRHVTRFWNREFVMDWGLTWPGDEERIPDCLKNYYC